MENAYQYVLNTITARKRITHAPRNALLDITNTKKIVLAGSVAKIPPVKPATIPQISVSLVLRGNIFMRELAWIGVHLLCLIFTQHSLVLKSVDPPNFCMASAVYHLALKVQLSLTTNASTRFALLTITKVLAVINVSTLAQKVINLSKQKENVYYVTILVKRVLVL